MPLRSDFPAARRPIQGEPRASTNLDVRRAGYLSVGEERHLGRRRHYFVIVGEEHADGTIAFKEDVEALEARFSEGCVQGSDDETGADEWAWPYDEPGMGGVERDRRIAAVLTARIQRE